MKKILLGFALLGIVISGSLFAVGAGVQHSSAQFPKSNPNLEVGPPLPRQMLTTGEYNALIDLLTGIVRHATTDYWGIGWPTSPERVPRSHVDINGALEVSAGDSCNVPASCDDARRGTVCFLGGIFYGCNQSGWVQLNL